MRNWFNLVIMGNEERGLKVGGLENKGVEMRIRCIMRYRDDG
jgi:hypothetical protein